MKNPKSVFVVRDGIERLCKDGCFRDFSCYGTPSWCFHEYRSVRHALNVAKRHNAEVAVIPDGMTIEAGGLVIETKPCPEKPGYITYHHHKLSEFFVKEA